jgi:integrase
MDDDTTYDIRVYRTEVYKGANLHRSRGGIFNDRTYLKVFHKARAAAFTGQEAVSLLARRPYDLRHAAVSTWLNAGIPAPQVAEWAGHSVDVLLRVYAKCISGQQHEAKRRIEEATRPTRTCRWPRASR